ncbi:MAG: hypothetical protein RL670_401, partial [Actinomycetota bacterium]
MLASSFGVYQLVTAVFYIFLARQLGPVDFGQLSIFIAVGNLLVTFSDFGSNAYSMRQMASLSMHLGEYLSRVFGKLVLTAGLAILTSLVSLIFLASSVVWVILATAITQLITQSAQVVAQSRSEIRFLAISVFIDRVIAIGVFMGLCLTAKTGFVLYFVLASICGSVGGAIFIMIKAIRDSPSSRQLTRKGFLNPWEGSKYFGYSNLANAVQTIDLLAVNIFAGAHQS